MNEWTLIRNIQRTLPDAQIVRTPLTLCPELELFLIGPENMQRSFAGNEIQAVLDNTPYWTFCWASGQALAYYILQHREAFAGKRILDFGSGSGVVAIAAAMAGAARVTACDVDGDAIDAIQANAALNHVRVHTCVSLDELTETIDLIIAADVLYDRENFHFLEAFLHRAPEVLVADSRAKHCDVPPYRRIAEITTHTLPDLEECDEFKRVAIYQALSPNRKRAYAE